MKAGKGVISHLNEVLTSELTSINQFFLHARMFKNWGLNQLNDKAYKKSIKDMKQADQIIERILFLEGLPNLQKLHQLSIGEHAEEMLNCDMKFEQAQLPILRKAIAHCESVQDYVSRDLLEEVLKDEEDYVDWLESQQYLIENSGIENYLQAQM
jgi:bacterioferritin